MRVICTIESQEEANGFSSFLKSKGIANQCEEVLLHGAKPLYRIWVLDEDQMEEAQNLYKSYKHEPVVLEPEILEEENSPKERSGLSPAPYGIISKAIIVSCILIFLWSLFHKGVTMPPNIPGIVPAPILRNVMKTLSYDYPEYFQLRDKLVEIYPAEAIKQKELPSPEAEALIEKIKTTPYWMGFYDRFVSYLKEPNYRLKYDGPMFEKISQGEVWRLVSPAILHFDLLHIFFNLLWFILLGNQVEYRIGKVRYLILIVTAALASNVSQYLMSGSFFMGLSGVVVALAAFIWARQQVAPWEGYLLQRVTIAFLGIFILGIFALQVVFFFLQLFTNVNINIQIANTAHLVGGAIGYLFGRMKFFSLRAKKNA